MAEDVQLGLRGVRTSTAQHGEPPWLADAGAHLAALRELPENWDSYGAARVDEGAITVMESLICSVMDAATPRPRILPTVRGGVQLEWHVNGIDLEVEADGHDRFAVLYNNPEDNVEWEGELDQSAPTLRTMLASISQRQ